MVCIYCSAPTRVTNSRPQKRLGGIWRRRTCTSCGNIFTSVEMVDYATSWTVAADTGQSAPFERDKLFSSILHVLGHRSDAVTAATALTATIIAKIRKNASDGHIERTAIIETSRQILQRFDRAAAVQYKAYHPIRPIK